MIDALTKITQAVVDWTGDRTNWAQWAGSIIIAAILGVWARLCLKKVEFIDLGTTAGLLVFAIFFLLARKAKPDAPAAKAPEDSLTQ